MISHSFTYHFAISSTIFPFPLATNMHRCIAIPGPTSTRVLDPRSRNIKRLNRFCILARGAALAIDPLFLFAVTASPGPKPCIYIDGTMLLVATLLRTCVDLLHVVHLWFKFRMAYLAKESLVVGSGELVWDARAVVKKYVGSLRGFWFDVYVILPLPQAVYWLILPKLLKEEKVEDVMTIIQTLFLLQFFPKLYHSFYLMRGVRKVTGYIFGTAWLGFILNLIAYFLASHVSGGFWYILSVQRIAECLKKQCHESKQCETLAWTCPRDICYSSYTNSCLANSTMKANFSTCMDQNGEFPYGNYAFALPLIIKNSNFVKILYSDLWGLLSLSTMGSNFTPTSQSMEATFAIIMVLAGLSLFTFLIGNIQVFFLSVTPRRRQMQLRYRDMKWWMGRRQLPSELRRRVRHYEHERWKTMGGQDEMKLMKNMPDGLRRDIKRYLCLEFVRKVPLFDNLDDLILDHICDRVIPMVYSKDEKILKEGEPVQRTVFIVKGSVMRSQNITTSMVTTTLIEPGGFIGDELIPWCLRMPFVDRFPPSSATFTCVEPIEAYGLNADQLQYITNHFRYTFSRGELKYKTRYYSSNWRSWAAVNIQFAWRRYLQRTRGDFVNSGTGNGGSSDGASTSSDQKLRRFAAMFMSLRPKDHLD